MFLFNRKLIRFSSTSSLHHLFSFLKKTIFEIWQIPISINDKILIEIFFYQKYNFWRKKSITSNITFSFKNMGRKFCFKPFVVRISTNCLILSYSVCDLILGSSSNRTKSQNTEKNSKTTNEIVWKKSMIGFSIKIKFLFVIESKLNNFPLL